MTPDSYIVNRPNVVIAAVSGMDGTGSLGDGTTAALYNDGSAAGALSWRITGLDLTSLNGNTQDLHG